MATNHRPLKSYVVPAAVVSRSTAFNEGHDHYLLLGEEGRLAWVEDPQAATSFPSMREATRMAFRLPASLKAYGLLRDSEITFHHDLH